jgi:hypothetical protein
LPGQPRRIPFPQQPQPMVTNLQMPIVRGFDRLLMPAVNGVVFQEVLDAVRCSYVARGDEVQVGSPSRS